MEAIYRLEGRVVHHDGEPAADVLVALTDDDWMWDDLLGVGPTGQDGAFHLSFTAAAFRQEPLELEATPDVYVVLSIAREGAMVPVHRVAFPALTFQETRGDLGIIVLPPRDAWSALDGVSPAPGWAKPARRVELSDALLGHAIAEIGPIVERLTGWSDIVRQTRVIAVPAPSDAWVPVLQAAGGGSLGRIERTAFDVLVGIGGLCGLYDPYGRTVYLVEATLGRQNLDGVKVMLGHELVHAGQFLHHPELVERYTEYVLSMSRANESDGAEESATVADDADANLFDPKLGPAGAAAYARSKGFMTNIEGYATYLEVDFLRRLYALATPLPHLSLWGKALVSLLQPANPTAGKGGVMTDKASEYEVGRAAYRRMQQGETPARFDPHLDPTAG